MSYSQYTLDFYGKDISGLVSGVGNAFEGAVQTVIDIGTQLSAIDLYAAQTDAMIENGISGATDLFQAVSDALKNKVDAPLSPILKAQIKRQLEILTNLWKGGITSKMGGAFASYAQTWFGTPSLLALYKTLRLQVGLEPLIRREYLRTYRPNIPDILTAFKMFKHGYISESTWWAINNNWGWDKKWNKPLGDVFSTNPSAYDAFTMWCKSLIKTDQRNLIYSKNLYDAADYELITKNFYHTFNVRELYQLADFVELDQIWTIKQLKANGVKDEDTARMWQLLQLRPLREEVRSLTTRWAWRRRMGRCTADDLDKAIMALGIKTKERELVEAAAEMYYEDELTDEWVECLRWRFRTAIITEEEFLNGLLDLNILLEKANVIVETEKAMGYYGYY